ncbi:uncharacterized protein EDB91DRAFT_1086781 [Suillus paluster]|uniref:uncharacterized protein n=1 Tax=Suillus paluster TaxID=48578 RepID=UPI001B87562F|nr:uncharacterized protein EDB91DRAFT_1086781 [Suillus paluster]KAG1726424.1 hypothetical protein EDB91DRAFT_1086781 [Suillus paluster]
MHSHPTVRFTEPLVTDIIDMDIDDASQAQSSTSSTDLWMREEWPMFDDLYLGLDNEVEYESMPPHISQELYLGLEDDFDGGIGVPEPSHRASSDPPGQAISLALYLGPEEMSDEPMEYSPPALDNEELQAMVQEFRPFGSYHDVGLQNLQTQLADFTTTHGNLPEPSIPQLLEAERPFRTAWAETSDKLARADQELQRMQRAEWDQGPPTEYQWLITDSQVPTTKYRQPIADDRPSTANIWSLAVDGRSSAIGRQYLVIGTWSSVISHWYSVGGPWSSAVNRQYIVFGSRYLVLGRRQSVVGNRPLVFDQRC